MKDQSNVLGRIEERFGEKFESLISRFDHLETKKISTEEKIDITQEEISKTLSEAIAELSKENQITKEQLESYKERLEQKNNEYQRLRNDLIEIKNESQNMRLYMNSNTINDNIERFISILTPKDVNYILNNKKLQRSNKTYLYAVKYGLCDDEGIIYPEIKNYLQRIINKNVNIHNF